ncbi:DUF4253 domain-containing protein, partial [Myxococcota bacterium]|nr:DUF4253 domain-containing protein [Myxococcota bacterium]
PPCLHSVEISERAYIFESDGCELHVPWKSIKSIDREGPFIVLRIERGSPKSVPIRAFENLAHLEEWGKEIEGRTGGKVSIEMDEIEWAKQAKIVAASGEDTEEDEPEKPSALTYLIRLILLVGLVCAAMVMVISRAVTNGTHEGDLTNLENKQLSQVAIEAHVAKIAKKRLNVPFSVLIFSPPSNSIPSHIAKHEEGVPGLVFNVDCAVAYEHLLALQTELSPKGYQPFISSKEGNPCSKVVLTILKAKEPYDVLRFQETNGTNSGIQTSDVIKKVKKWNKEYGAVVTSVNSTSLELHFNKIPTDLISFSKELNTFCPDMGEFCLDTPKDLKEHFMSTKYLYIWWD